MLLKACASSRVIHQLTKRGLRCPAHIYKGALIDGSVFHSLLYPNADVFGIWKSMGQLGSHHSYAAVTCRREVGALFSIPI